MNTRTPKSQRAKLRPLPTSPYLHTGAHDLIIERTTANVHGVEFRLQQEIIHVDDGVEQLILGDNVFQLENTCGRAAAAAAAVVISVAVVGVVAVLVRCVR